MSLFQWGMNRFSAPDIYSLVIHPIALATLPHLGIFLSLLCVCFSWILFHESPGQERQIIGESAMQTPYLSSLPFKTGSSQSGRPYIPTARSFTLPSLAPVPQGSPSLWIFPDWALPALLACHSLPTTRVEVPLLCLLMALGLCCSRKEDGRKEERKDSSCFFSFFIRLPCTSFPGPLFSFVCVSLGYT